MLSWRDEEDTVTRRGSGGGSRTGSLTRPTGSSFESSRLGSMPRRSMEVTSPSGSVPKAGSLPKATSLLRGPAHAAEGSIGSEGWWHHMDHAAANEAPEEDTKAAPAKGFVAQTAITGQRQSLWADETPAAPAPAAPSAAAPAAAVASIVPEGPIAASAAAASGAPPAASEGKGWWNKMDNSVLNAQPETVEAGAVKKGERVMGGGFTPQFGVAGGNAYKSIFAEGEEAQAQAKQEAVTEQVAGWAPFAGACAPAAAAGAGAGADDDWSGFASASAPPPARVM